MLFDRKTALRKLVFIFGEILISFIIANSIETVSIIKDISGYIGQIQVGLVGIVFTGYALFQALIGDSLLLFLLSLEENEKSKLEESNESFISLVIVQIIAVLIDFLFYVVMCSVSAEWHLTNSNIINVMLSVIGVVSLFYINIEAIWEMKSFIFNVYQLFNAHAMSRVIDIIEKNKDDKQ